MKGMNIFDAIFKFVAVLGLGASVVSFVGGKTDAAKYDDRGVKTEIVEQGKLVSQNTSDIKVNNERIGSLKEDVKEIKDNVSEIRDLLYEERGWNKPALGSKNAPLVKGLNVDGSPKQ